MSLRTREVHLAARPTGTLTRDAFRTVTVELPDPGPGEVLVANTLMSVDPYMRGRMDAGPSYMPAYELDRPLEGGTVGRVVASRSDDVAVGTLVTHGLGWREHSLVPARHVRPIDDRAAPPGAYLGVLGSPGWTAYVGLLEIGALRDGDVVFVSGAAGAVGSIAGQIARIRGHRVIGSAGSAAKVAYLRDQLGFDAAFDYRAQPSADALAAAAPDGIDVYFDNVGGEQLEAALDAMRMFGRVAVCGAIAGYDDERPPGPSNLHLLFARRITMRGFMVRDHRDRFADFRRDVTAWLADGRLRADETVVDGGIDAAPDALIGLLRGDNVGKMLVRLAEDPGPAAG